MSTATTALAELITRAETITPENGYTTDAGERVFDWPAPVEVEVDRFPRLCLYAESDAVIEAELADGSAEMDMRLEVVALVQLKADNDASTEIFAVIDDLKTALLESDDRTLSGTVHDLEYSGFEIQWPKTAESIVAAEVRFGVIYSESYGAP